MQRGAARVVVLTQEAMAMGHIIAKPGIAGIQDLKGKRLGFSGVGFVTHFSALSLARQLGWTANRDIALVGGFREYSMRSSRTKWTRC